MFYIFVYTKNMNNNVNENINRINKRFKIVFIIVLIFFVVIVFGLIKVCIFDNDKYNKLLHKKTDKIFYGIEPPRGNIYDRNLKLLVGNKLVKSIIYIKTDLSPSKELLLASKVSDNITIDYKDLTNQAKEEYLYIKNKNILKSRLKSKEIIKYENKEYSIDEYKKLLVSKIKEDEFKLNEKDKKVAYIYFLMNKGYSYDEKVIKEEATEKEYAFFSENEKIYKGIKSKTSYKRVYPYKNLFKTFLGSVGSIPKEEKEYYKKLGYSMSDKVGISYIEKEYEKYLKGTKESYKVDVKGKKTKLTSSSRGNDLVLTIDIDLQKKVEKLVKEEMRRAKRESNTRYYNKSYVILSDPNNGEILASVGKQILYNGHKYTFVDSLPSLLTNPVTPGSIVKGASHLVGYETGNIKFGQTVRDSCIKIASTPPKCSWTRLGYVNDLTALSMSSNYYQFLTAIKVGKGNYSYNRGLKLNKKGFKTYRDMYKQFGLGSSTGIDMPKEGKGYVGNDKKASHLLDFPIGQYDTYTPLQIMQYINTLAMSGERYSLHYLKKVYSGKKDDLTTIMYDYDKKLLNNVKVKKKYMKRVRTGLKNVTISGTGKNYINLKYKPSGKTGTSQSFIDTDDDEKIDKETISTLFGAYMPRNEPKVAILVINPDISVESKNEHRSMITKTLTKKVTNLYFKK